MSINVNADTHRICQALTVPEYLEAWIRIPDQPAGSQTLAYEHANGYRLDHSAAGRIVASIHGSYLFRHRRKMRLFWRTTRGLTCAESLVDFRLRGNFGSSILELRQTVLTPGKTVSGIENSGKDRCKRWHLFCALRDPTSISAFRSKASGVQIAPWGARQILWRVRKNQTGNLQLTGRENAL